MVESKQMHKSEFARISKAVIARLIGAGLPFRQDSHDELVALVARQDDYFHDVRAVLTIDPKARWSEDARMDLTRQAVEPCERLQKEFAKEYKYVVRTAAEEAERLAKEEAENRRLKVQRMAEYPSKGLRAGGNARTVSRELFTGCPDGTYEVSYDDGKRQCRVVLRPGNATIRRLG